MCVCVCVCVRGKREWALYHSKRFCNIANHIVLPPFPPWSYAHTHSCTRTHTHGVDTTLRTCGRCSVRLLHLSFLSSSSVRWDLHKHTHTNTHTRIHTHTFMHEYISNFFIFLVLALLKNQMLCPNYSHRTVPGQLIRIDGRTLIRLPAYMNAWFPNEMSIVRCLPEGNLYLARNSSAITNLRCCDQRKERKNGITILSEQAACPHKKETRKELCSKRS